MREDINWRDFPGGSSLFFSAYHFGIAEDKKEKDKKEKDKKEKDKKEKEGESSDGKKTL